MKIAEAYTEICALACERGLVNLRSTPGLTTIKIDDYWTARINPHESAIDGVRPFEIGLTFNGWPAGMVAPSGGIVAAGRVANEDALIAAIKRQHNSQMEPPTGP